MSDKKRLESNDNQGKILDRQEFVDFLEKETVHPGFLAQVYEKALQELENPTIVIPPPSNETSQVRPVYYDFLQYGIPHHYNEEEGRIEFRTKLFRLTAAATIERMLDALNSEPVSHLLEFLKTADYEKDGEILHEELRNCIDGKGAEMWKDLNKTAEELLNARQMLRKFVIDRVDSDTGKQILPFPFDEGDPDEEPWESILDITANLGHSLDKVAGIGKIFEYFFRQKFSIPGDLTMQVHAKSLPGAQKLLNGYKRNLLETERSEKIQEWSFLEDVKYMLEAQFGDEMGPLPIKVEIAGQPILDNADEDAMTTAILEIARGAFSEGKVSKERLMELYESGESYLHIKVEGITHNGLKLICIAVMDKGTPIDVEEIATQEELPEYDWVTITSILAKKGVTYFMDHHGNRNGHKGRGLYVANQITLDHNGDFYAKNTEDGVGFLIAIPVEGKGSKHPNSFQIFQRVLYVINPDPEINKKDLLLTAEDEEEDPPDDFDIDADAYAGFVIDDDEE